MFPAVLLCLQPPAGRKADIAEGLPAESGAGQGCDRLFLPDSFDQNEPGWVLANRYRRDRTDGLASWVGVFGGGSPASGFFPSLTLTIQLTLCEVGGGVGGGGVGGGGGGGVGWGGVGWGGGGGVGVGGGGVGGGGGGVGGLGVGGGGGGWGGVLGGGGGVGVGLGVGGGLCGGVWGLVGGYFCFFCGVVLFLFYFLFFCFVFVFWLFFFGVCGSVTVLTAVCHSLAPSQSHFTLRNGTQQRSEWPERQSAGLEFGTLLASARPSFMRYWP